MKRTLSQLLGVAMAVLLGIQAPQVLATTVISPIVVEGDDVPSIGQISGGTAAILNLTVGNGGHWLVEADTNNSDTNVDGVVLKGTGANAGVLFFQESQPLTLPAGTSIDSFDSLTINTAGNGAFNFFLAGATTTTDSGVFYNASLVIQESTLSTSSEFSPNTPYIGWFEVKFNDNNQILMVASLDDPAIATTVDRALVIVNNPTGVYTEDVLVKEGDVLDGQALSDVGIGPHNIAFNYAGHVLYIADRAGDAMTDGIVYLHDGTNSILKAQEGMSSGAVAGRNWLTLLSRPIDLNNNDDWVIRADLDGDATDNVVIVRNGTTVIAREGESLPAIGGIFTFTGFGTGPVAIADNGDVFWFGDWNDPDTSRDTGIFLNDQLIVQEGVTAVGAFTITSIVAGESGFDVSPDAHWLVFEGARSNPDLPTNPLEGAFLVEITGATGDMNCDTLINGQDVAAFSLAVLDPNVYGTTYPGCPILNGDFSGNSVTDASDIPSLVDALLFAS